MDFNVENAINKRRSARSFKMQKLPNETIDALQVFAKNIQAPFDHTTEIRFFNAEPTKTLYMTFQSPPNNVAFISETDIINISKTGFIGEILILFAESLNISTCWYGHYKLSELEKIMPHLENSAQLNESNMGYGYSKGITTGRRTIAISPIGLYEDKGFRLMDRLTKGTVSFKRKEIPELLVDTASYNNMPIDVKYAIDLARKAPSAANSQMWRFAFDNNFKNIQLAMPVGYRHFKWEHPNVDIGICASHLWLGLVMKGYDPKVSVILDKERAVWNFQL